MRVETDQEKKDNRCLKKKKNWAGENFGGHLNADMFSIHFVVNENSQLNLEIVFNLELATGPDSSIFGTKLNP